MKKFKNYLKILIFIFCIIFISYNLYNNSEILNDLSQNKSLFYILVVLKLFFVNIVCLRAFLFIKGSVGYLYSFLDWAKLHFVTRLLDATISFTGLVYKGIELKKRSINFTKFIAISYFLIGLYISITLMFILCALLFFYQIYIPAFLTLVTSICIICFSPLILRFFLNYLVRLKKIKKYIGAIKNLVEILNNMYLNKKTILITVAITAIIHLIEFSIFYITCSIFLDNIDLKFVIGFFGANFIINRIPFVSAVPGVQEITLGMVSLPFGVFFVEGLIIALSIRFLNIISYLVSGGIYFILGFYDKNKFVNQ